MEMSFGKAHDIWSRVISDDRELTEDEVNAAAQWFDDFIVKLNDKVNQSTQELEISMQTHDADAIEKKCKAKESDIRQLNDFIRKYDDLINWLNMHK